MSALTRRLRLPAFDFRFFLFALFSAFLSLLIFRCRLFLTAAVEPEVSSTISNPVISEFPGTREV